VIFLLTAQGRDRIRVSKPNPWKEGAPLFGLLKRTIRVLAVAAALSLPSLVGALSGTAWAHDCSHAPVAKEGEAVDALH
jgi:hypothetical protein